MMPACVDNNSKNYRATSVDHAWPAHLWLRVPLRIFSCSRPVFHNRLHYHRPHPKNAHLARILTGYENLQNAENDKTACAPGILDKKREKKWQSYHHNPRNKIKLFSFWGIRHSVENYQTTFIPSLRRQPVDTLPNLLKNNPPYPS